MEVKNQMVDQLLSTGMPAPGAQAPKAQKDANGPDFDSMVHQRRAAGKNETKDPKRQKAEKPEKTVQEKPQTEETQEPAAGEANAAAVAAMLFQTKPELRLTPEADEASVAQVNIIAGGEPGKPVIAPSARFVASADNGPAQSEAPAVPELDAEPEKSGKAKADPWHTTWTPKQPKVLVGNEDEGEEETAVKPGHKVGRDEHADDVFYQPAEKQTRSEKILPTERSEGRARVSAVEERPEEVRPEAAQTVTAKPAQVQTEAAAVKQTETARPLPLTADDGVDQLAGRLEDAVVNRADIERVEITLTPETLGKLTVEISRDAGGRLSIVLRPTTERAANILERSTGDLQRALAASAKNETDVQVRPNDETTRYFDPNGRGQQHQQQQQQQEQQQQRERRDEQRSAQDFVQQLRLGLLDNEDEDKD